ncbi:rCG33625, isoform CRA_b [Rattus norvegicus]|uniref:RCG33625, isoform CRA_b n=1 Tax=Rattus norvegicus TaxID=10116 RepID=A6HCR6_RAT|nr:rCG33625, isoform CRA_b [Rattus norvegicus]
MMDMTRIKVICTKWTMCVCQCLQAGVSMQVSTPEVRSLEPQSPAPSRCARRQALVFGWGLSQLVLQLTWGLSFCPVLILSMFT